METVEKQLQNSCKKVDLVELVEKKYSLNVKDGLKKCIFRVRDSQKMCIQPYKAK